MHIEDAQRENRSVYIGGFWGQLVSSVIWLAAAAVGTWVTPKASILTAVIGGFFIFPLVLFLFLAGILIAAGVLTAHYYSRTFSPGAWIGGLVLFVFAWIGRSIATSEGSAPSTP